MASYRRELPAQGLARIDVELWRGNLTVRPARPGEICALESCWELDVTTDSGVLRARQPLDIKRPLDLADLIGEQQVRIEIEGVVLLDKQIRHGGGDVEIVLPASVGEVRLRTARGDIRLEGIEADSETYTGRGNVLLSDGRGRAEAGTGVGDVKVSRWLGLLRVRTGKGNIEVAGARGDLEAKTGKGEVRIDGAQGRIDAHTGHGNLVASRVSGSASLSTDHGDLLATDLEGVNLQGFTRHGEIVVGGRLIGAKVKTGHGDIVCRLVAAEGDHELHTGRGSISLDLREGVAARIDASTRHGGIDSNLPLVRVGTSGPEGIFGQRLVGTAAGAAGPTAKISLLTRYGDVRVFRRGGGAAYGAPDPDGGGVAVNVGFPSEKPNAGAAAQATTPKETGQLSPETAPGDEKLVTASQARADQPGGLEMEVLGAVSSGELSVEEAMALLGSIWPGPGQE